MGEAKQRGSYEMRKQKAISRSNKGAAVSWMIVLAACIALSAYLINAYIKAGQSLLALAWSN